MPQATLTQMHLNFPYVCGFSAHSLFFVVVVLNSRCGRGMCGTHVVAIMVKHGWQRIGQFILRLFDVQMKSQPWRVSMTRRFDAQHSHRNGMEWTIPFAILDLSMLMYAAVQWAFEARLHRQHRHIALLKAKYRVV